MPEKKTQVHIEIAIKKNILEEEFFHCITYMVQHFACAEDAKKIQKLFDEKSIEHQFIGKNTKIKFTPVVNSDSDDCKQMET